jgi:hypothetical protein
MKPVAISSPAASSGSILYQAYDGRTQVECRFENETMHYNLYAIIPLATLAA